MAEAVDQTETVTASSRGGRQRNPGAVGTIAWRNLWRNRRRTWLTSGGIAFSVWLLVVAISMQDGTFEIMIDNGARLALGHVQIQHPDYQNDPRMEYTFTGSGALVESLSGVEGVTIASERVQGFALISNGERSFGAQVTGVDAAREASWSTLPEMVIEGRYLAGPGEAFIGSILARNLGARLGDEIVLLGTAREGGVAAVVAKVVGIFSSGQTEIDRGLMQIPIDDFREAWNLADDEAHSVVILADSVAESERVAERLIPENGAQWRVLDWRELMPEAVQTIDIKYIGAQLFFGLISVIVTFSIVNTFMMTVFERTPEFGMLMAIGMKPAKIMWQLAHEAFYLALFGVGLGIAASVLLLVPLAEFGVPLPAEASEMLKQYNLPDRMYPRFSTDEIGRAHV